MQEHIFDIAVVVSNAAVAVTAIILSEVTLKTIHHEQAEERKEQKRFMRYILRLLAPLPNGQQYHGRHEHKES